MVYHSGGIPDLVNKSTFTERIGCGSFITLPSGNIEYCSPRELLNTGTEQLIPCGYIRKNRVFSGWRLRLHIGKKWFWVLENGSLIPKAEGADKAAVFSVESCIPYIPVNKIDSMVAEAIWERNPYAVTVHFNSGITSLKGKSHFSKITGTTKLLKNGSMEYTPKSLFENTGEKRLPRNRFKYRGKKFVGWRVRIKERDIWHWVLENGSFVPLKSYLKSRDGGRMLLKDQAVIPKFTTHDVTTVVFEASWKE